MKSLFAAAIAAGLAAELLLPQGLALMIMTMAGLGALAVRHPPQPIPVRVCKSVRNV